MTPVDLLVGQIRAVERSLDRASDSLSKQPKAVGSALLQRVRGRFENDLLGLRNRCGDLRSRIQAGASAESGWANLVKLQKDSSDLLRECLAFLEGALVRTAGLDGGVCALADKMLDGLNQKTDLGWQRFTLVAAGELYSTISGIVRLRFTDTDIWSLPVAAHEFGHFVSGTPRFAQFAELTDSEKRTDRRYEFHLRELFSDLFATYALGPSLVLACALLRFSPANAFAESDTHPSNAQRVWWMLETLACMDKTEREGMYEPIAGKIRECWAAALKASGQAQALSDAEIVRLRPWLLDLYDLVNSRIPVVRYRSLLRAQEMRQALRNGQTPAQRNEDEIPDVLNAAWLYRLNMSDLNAYEIDGLGEKTFQMCENIANREGDVQS
jgi:hypothetical protein